MASFFACPVSLLLSVAQVSYGASTPTLSDRTMFPKFFRTIPSEVQANSARFALMERFNWERVATLHETRNIFSLVRFNFDSCRCLIPLTFNLNNRLNSALTMFLIWTKPLEFHTTFASAHQCISVNTSLWYGVWGIGHCHRTCCLCATVFVV